MYNPLYFGMVGGFVCKILIQSGFQTSDNKRISNYSAAFWLFKLMGPHCRIIVFKGANHCWWRRIKTLQRRMEPLFFPSLWWDVFRFFRNSFLNANCDVYFSNIDENILNSKFKSAWCLNHTFLYLRELAVWYKTQNRVKNEFQHFILTATRIELDLSPP